MWCMGGSVKMNQEDNKYITTNDIFHLPSLEKNKWNFSVHKLYKSQAILKIT